MWDCAVLDHHLPGTSGIVVTTRLAPGTQWLPMSDVRPPWSTTG
jgi:hypothetical protein